ncbi:MAG: hypothetical protein SGJ27_10450 [Candidatus Melainabacteria bacterium]|nr:hypothetical protein [Candidatus Melainabacteria bacterium]
MNNLEWQGAPDKPCRNSSLSGLSADELLLLSGRLPHDLDPLAMEQAWHNYQVVIERFMARMGSESAMLESMKRVMLVRNLGGVLARVALIPKLGNSILYVLKKRRLTEIVCHLAGECALMELSAAAGYRTFCFPNLVRGLLKTGKMRDYSVERMLDTFEFLNTMMQYPFNDPRVLAQIERTNKLHARYKVAGKANPAAQDLFKYIALNMFYVGPRMRTDLTPEERHAICGLTVLVSKRMGHSIEGSVLELEAFIDDYEASQMFDRNDPGQLRRQAVEIAHASTKALEQIPTILPARIHGYVPHSVKKILELE